MSDSSRKDPSGRSGAVRGFTDREAITHRSSCWSPAHEATYEVGCRGRRREVPAAPRGTRWSTSHPLPSISSAFLPARGYASGCCWAVTEPPKPFPGQMTPDARGRCPGRKQLPINGGCWVEQMVKDAEECAENGYVFFKARCYAPALDTRRKPPPTSAPSDSRLDLSPAVRSLWRARTSVPLLAAHRSEPALAGGSGGNRTRRSSFWRERSNSVERGFSLHPPAWCSRESG